MTRIHQAFRELHDPRITGRTVHNLLDIIVLSIIAVVCGAESWDAIELPIIYDTLFGEYNKKFQSLLANEQSQPRTRLLLENRFKMWPITYLWGYEMRYGRNHKDNPLPISFYDFLHTISMNDKTLLADEDFSTFINRFEFCNSFQTALRAMFAPKKTFWDYLFTELALEKRPKTNICLRWLIR